MSILDIIHKTIYEFIDDDEVMSDKDKLLLEVNKAICNNLKALEPCKDAISRQAVLERLKREEKILYTPTGMNYLIRAIEEMPSVTPQYTDAEIQKIQEMEQAELEKAYELGKVEQFDNLEEMLENCGIKEVGKR